MCIAPSFAQAPLAPRGEGRNPDHEISTPIVISGAQPGPGMWKVSKGDHVLWVLGTLSPLPKSMEWQSRDVEAVFAQAQEVMSAPGCRLEREYRVLPGPDAGAETDRHPQESGWRQSAAEGAGGHVRALVGVEAQVHRQRPWHRDVAAALRRHQAVRRCDRQVRPDQSSDIDR